MSGGHSELCLAFKIILYFCLITTYGFLCGTMISLGIIVCWLAFVWGLLGYKPLLGTEIVYFSDQKRHTNVVGCVNVQGTTVDDLVPLLKKLPYFACNTHMLSRVVTILGERYWSPPAEELNWADHIHVMHRHMETHQEIATLAAQKIEEPFDMARPLWEITIVDSFRRSELVLYFKFHHSLTDGLSSVNCIMGNLAEDYKGLLHKLPVIPWYKKVLTVVLLPVCMLTLLFRLLFVRKDNNIFTARVARENEAVLCAPIDLARVKTASKRLNVTVNDLLASAVLLGIKRYMEKYGSASDHSSEVIKAGLPIIMKENTHGLRAIRLDPSLSLLYVDLPLPPADLKSMTPSYINCVRHSIGKVKDSFEPLAVYYLGQVASLFVPSLLLSFAVVHAADKMSFLFTNIAGCPARLHISGREVTGMYCFAPTYSDIPFAVAVASYAGEVRISCISNQLPVEDLGYMMEQMHAAVIGLDYSQQYLIN